MSAHPTAIRISESGEVPITTGTVEVDTSKGSVIIFMKPAPIHSKNETLTIKKISPDNNMVSLFSETTLINKADIVMFGLPSYAKVRSGKVRTLVLKSDGANWKIVHQE